MPAHHSMAPLSQEETLDWLNIQQKRLADTISCDDVLDAAIIELRSHADHVAVCASALLPYQPAHPELKELAQASNPKPKARSSDAKKFRAIATITACWGQEIITHYSWLSCGRPTLQKLAAVAERYHTWSHAVQRINAAMLSRHVKAVSSNASDGIIGDRIGGATNCGPSQPIQAKDLGEVEKRPNNGIIDLGYKQVMETGGGHNVELQVEIDRWATCDNVPSEVCLSCDSPNQWASLRLDKYGLLVPRPFRKRQNEVTSAPAAKKPKAGHGDTKGGRNTRSAAAKLADADSTIDNLQALEQSTQPTQRDPSEHTLPLGVEVISSAPPSSSVEQTEASDNEGSAHTALTTPPTASSHGSHLENGRRATAGKSLPGHAQKSGLRLPAPSRPTSHLPFSIFVTPSATPTEFDAMMDESSPWSSLSQRYHSEAQMDQRSPADSICWPSLELPAEDDSSRLIDECVRDIQDTSAAHMADTRPSASEPCMLDVEPGTEQHGPNHGNAQTMIDTGAGPTDAQFELGCLELVNHDAYDAHHASEPPGTGHQQSNDGCRPTAPDGGDGDVTSYDSTTNETMGNPPEVPPSPSEAHVLESLTNMEQQDVDDRMQVVDGDNNDSIDSNAEAVSIQSEVQLPPAEVPVLDPRASTGCPTAGGVQAIGDGGEDDVDALHDSLSPEPVIDRTNTDALRLSSHRHPSFSEPSDEMNACMHDALEAISKNDSARSDLRPWLCPVRPARLCDQLDTDADVLCVTYAALKEHPETRISLDKPTMVTGLIGEPTAPTKYTGTRSIYGPEIDRSGSAWLRSRGGRHLCVLIPASCSRDPAPEKYGRTIIMKDDDVLLTPGRNHTAVVPLDGMIQTGQEWGDAQERSEPFKEMPQISHILRFIMSCS